MLAVIGIDAYNTSKYVNITQTDAGKDYWDNYDKNDDVFINGTFHNHDNVTQAGGYISTGVNNRLTEEIVAYLSLIVGILGLLGHILSLIILLRPPFNDMPHCLFCINLACIDIVYMLLLLNFSSIQIVTGKSAMLLSTFWCKLMLSFGYLCIHLDSWVLVGLSVERLIGIFYPLRCNLIITKRRIKIFLVIIFIFLTAFHAESSVRYGLVEIRKGESFIQNCQPVYFYGLPRKYFYIKDQILLFLLSVIPSLVISICNMAILIKLVHRKRAQVRFYINSPDNNDTRTNSMLISVMISYVLLNLPAQIYSVIVTIQTNDFDDSFLKFLIFLGTVGIALNYYLYFCTSNLFRNAVKNLFQFNCKVGGVSRQTGRERFSNPRARSVYHRPVGEVEISLNSGRRIRYDDLFRQSRTTTV